MSFDASKAAQTEEGNQQEFLLSALQWKENATSALEALKIQDSIDEHEDEFQDEYEEYYHPESPEEDRRSPQNYWSRDGSFHSVPEPIEYSKPFDIRAFKDEWRKEMKEWEKQKEKMKVDGHSSPPRSPKSPVRRHYDEVDDDWN